MANGLRNYILTVNNPAQKEDEFYDYLKALPHIKYFIFQREKGETTGTEHYQLYIEFELGKTFKLMKEYFPTAHIEQRKGSKKQAREYCSKDDTRISDKAYEFGTFEEERERTDITDIIAMIVSGATDEEIQEAYPSQYFRNYKNIEHIRQKHIERKFSNVFRKLEVIYIYGVTGAGKTRKVMEDFGYENVYRVTNYDRSAFDTYRGQDVISFEEFRGGFKAEQMLNFLDGYPLMLPARYNDKVACFTKVFIVTNIPLYEQYPTLQEKHPETWQAFLRRINKVYEYISFGIMEIPKEKAAVKPLSEAELSNEQEQLPY